MKQFMQLGLIGALVMLYVVPVTGQSKLSLSFSAAPVYSHTDGQTTLPIYDPAIPSATTELVNNGHSFSYSAGLLARYRFSTHWSASTGIWATHLLSSSGDFYQNGIKTVFTYKDNHPFSYTYKIPLLINYQLTDKRLSPYFSAGVTFDLRGISYVDLGNGQEAAVRFGKPLVITPLLGAGISYRFTDHLSLIAQPTIQYDIQSRPSYSYYHGYQLSLQIQLLYKF